MRQRFPAGVLAAVAVGGAAGTLLRAWLAQVWPPSTNGFPTDTFAVNLTGSLVLGFVIVAALERAAPSRYVRPLLGTGFCGGLTTFSTFAVETDLLIRAGRTGLALAYVVASVMAGLIACRAGMGLARLVWSREVA